MRKALLATMVVTLLVAMLGAPATAHPADKTDVIPLDYSFAAWNPCTEEESLTHFTGELQVRAVPSIEAFYTDEWTHLTLKWVGQFIADDGYSTAWKHYATQVVNVQEGDLPPHLVINEVDHILFSGDDGGKYKVSSRFHITEVDGEAKAFADVFEAKCIRQPRS